MKLRTSSLLFHKTAIVLNMYVHSSYITYSNKLLDSSLHAATKFMYVTKRYTSYAYIELYVGHFKSSAHCMFTL
jgi:hypothetical protein